MPRKKNLQEGVFLLTEELATCLEISSTNERVQFVVTWVANTPFDKTWHRFDDNNKKMDCK